MQINGAQSVQSKVSSRTRAFGTALEKHRQCERHLEGLKISLLSFRVITERIGAFASSTTTTTNSSAFVSPLKKKKRGRKYGARIQLQACKSVIEPVETWQAEERERHLGWKKDLASGEGATADADAAVGEKYSAAGELLLLMLLMAVMMLYSFFFHFYR